MCEGEMLQIVKCVNCLHFFIESVLTFALLCWFDCLSVKNKNVRAKYAKLFCEAQVQLPSHFTYNELNLFPLVHRIYYFCFNLLPAGCAEHIFGGV